ncbi:unnamed protein product [Boreogadus saida]
MNNKPERRRRRRGPRAPRSGASVGLLRAHIWGGGAFKGRTANRSSEHRARETLICGHKLLFFTPDIRGDVCSGLTLRISTKITNAPRMVGGERTVLYMLNGGRAPCGSIDPDRLPVMNRMIDPRVAEVRLKQDSHSTKDAHALNQVCVSGLNAEHWDPTAWRDGPHGVEGRTPRRGGTDPTPRRDGPHTSEGLRHPLVVLRSPGAYITHCSGRGECAFMNHFISGRTSAFRQGQSRLSGAEARPPPAGSPALGAGAP